MDIIFNTLSINFTDDKLPRDRVVIYTGDCGDSDMDSSLISLTTIIEYLDAMNSKVLFVSDGLPSALTNYHLPFIDLSNNNQPFSWDSEDKRIFIDTNRFTAEYFSTLCSSLMTFQYSLPTESRTTILMVFYNTQPSFINQISHFEGFLSELRPLQTICLFLYEKMEAMRPINQTCMMAMAGNLTGTMKQADLVRVKQGLDNILA